ncbi:hypothetical protein QLG25_14135 [Pseudomonas sp. CBR-F]
MNTNQTIDGVSRDSVLLLVEFLADARAYHKVVIERCNDCVKSGESSERDEYGRIGYRTEMIEQVERLAEELRALLDANPEENTPCPQCGGSLRTWGCTCDPRWPSYKADSKQPAAQPQGEPVVWLDPQSGRKANTISAALKRYNESKGGAPAAATALYTVPLYAEQPAPVAVVLPKRLQGILTFLDGSGTLDGYSFGDVHTSRRKFWWRNELRACLDELKRLNPSL